MNKKIVKICMFDKNSTPSQIVGYNGDYILDNICIKCEVTEGIDGTHELDAEFICDSEGLYKVIHDEAIVKVQMDYGEEIFRIAKITKNRRDIVTFARQITISETLDMWLEDVRPTDTSGIGALTHMKNNSIGKKDIQVFSNINTISTAYYQRMCMYKALHDCDQAFLTRWGGEILRRGYNLTINDRIGSDRGVEIRSRKNLTGFEANTNIDNVVTRIRPVGFNGITTGTFVDSPLINKYSSVKTKEIKYEDVKVKDENNPDEGYDTLGEAQAELIRRAKLEFTENHIDELRGDYRINFVYLEQTEEYKDYVQAERVYLGDTVSVYEETHDINIHVRVVRRKYDVLRQRVIEIELSNQDISQKTITTSDILAELQSVIKGTNNNNVQDIIQSMINSGIKDSYVIPRQNEIIVADNKDLNLAHNVCRLNKNGLAFSKTGYYGDYEYGFTIDGVINASLIATGILSTILIQNADGSLQIDLSGTNGIMTKKNGKNAIELAGTIMKFFDWDGEGDAIGQLYSARLNNNENVPGIVLANKLNSYLSLAYEKDGTFYSYIICDKDNIDGTTDVPITFFEETEFKKYIWVGYGINSIYNSTKNNFVNRVKNNFVVVDADTLLDRLSLSKNHLSLYEPTDVGNIYCLISPNETYFAKNKNKYFSASESGMYGYKDGTKYCSIRPNGFEFYKDGDDILYTTTIDTIQSDRSMHINGNFTVNGNKNCVQTTTNYGDRLFYSIEDCESYLTDRSMELFTVEETNEGTYERVILLDNIFKESVNLDIEYTVEIIKQGWGDYKIKEQTKDYFIVESDRKDFTFKYIVTGKRKGFEDERNKEVFTELIQELSKYENNLSMVNTDYVINSNLPIQQNEYWRLYSRQETA